MILWLKYCLGWERLWVISTEGCYVNSDWLLDWLTGINNLLVWTFFWMENYPWLSIWTPSAGPAIISCIRYGSCGKIYHSVLQWPSFILPYGCAPCLLHYCIDNCQMIRWNLGIWWMAAICISSFQFRNLKMIMKEPKCEDKPFYVYFIKIESLLWIYIIAVVIVEFCLTSNVKSGTVSEYGRHQFEYWYQRNHPCILCVSILKPSY